MAKGPAVFRFGGPAPRKAWRTTRTSRQARGLGGDWERRRAEQLAREPLCRICAAAGRLAVAAEEVDHITPRALGGSSEPDNLQSLCTPCHKVKTAAEARASRMAAGRRADA